jgi:hypothetical protein
VTWIPWILSSVSALVALISLLRTFVVAGAAEATQTAENLTKLQERVSLVEMKIGMFWRMVEENMSGLLKRPTHLTMDALLDKLKRHTITLDECYQLRRQLEAAYLAPDAEMPETSNRLIAILVKGAVEALILELEHH